MGSKVEVDVIYTTTDTRPGIGEVKHDDSPKAAICSGITDNHFPTAVKKWKWLVGWFVNIIYCMHTRLIVLTDLLYMFKIRIANS